MTTKGSRALGAVLRLPWPFVLGATWARPLPKAVIPDGRA